MPFMNEMRMKKLLRPWHLLLAAFILGQVHALAQSPADSLLYRARVLGENKKAGAQLESLAGFSKAEALQRQDIESGLRRVWEYLRAQRYYGARLDSAKVLRRDKSDNQTIDFYFYLGTPTELHVTTTWRDSSTADKYLERELRGRHDENEWRRRLENVLYDFGCRGYPLAAFQLDSVHHEEDAERRQARLYLSFVPGPLVAIDSILIRGNKFSQPKVLLRELPVQAGGKFNLEEVQKIPERLMRLGFLQSVAPPELLMDGRGRYLLLIEVQEGNSNFLNGVAGYNPAAGTQQGYFTGLIDVHFNNLLGTGRAFSARWEKRGIETQELGLRYREPWIFAYPLHVSGGFQQLIQDTLYVERKWDFTLEMVPWAERITLLGAVARESVSPDSLAALRLQVPGSSTTNFLAGWRYDSRDDLVNPQKGIYFATTLAYGQKRLDTSAVAQRFTRQQVTVDFHALAPTFWPQVVSFAVHGRQVTSDEPFVSITDQIRFGGATTLRGYREDEFRGSRVAWSNIEYRYLLARRSRAFMFCDLGYYFREEAAPANAGKITSEEVKISYGLGVRLDSPIGVVGLDYGIGKGDDWLNGKVHVSLVNSF